MLCNIKEKKLYIFSAIIVLLYFLHIILFIQDPEGPQSLLYFRSFEDLGADFFNCCILVADKNPYFSDYFFQSNYLPLVNMIFYPFSKLADYRNFTLIDCWNSHIALFSCFIFVFFSSLIFIHSIICLCKKYNTNKIILIPIILSGVFLHTIERGNILILSTALLLYFLTYYDSDNSFLSFFAAICLSLVAIMKVYPVVFGILYLLNIKKYSKQIIVSVCAFILFGFLPFLFFEHGFENLPQLFTILSNTATPFTDKNIRFDFTFCAYIFLYQFNYERFSAYTVIIRYFTIFISVFSLILVFFTKDTFKKLCLIILPILYIPTFSWFYCAIYLIPAMIYFFGVKDYNYNNFFNLIVSIFFVLIFLPIGFSNSEFLKLENINIRLIILNVSCGIFWFYIIFDTIKQLRK